MTIFQAMFENPEFDLSNLFRLLEKLRICQKFAAISTVISTRHEITGQSLNASALVHFHAMRRQIFEKMTYILHILATEGIKN